MRIVEDEWYPCYSAHDLEDGPFKERYEAVQTLFSLMQGQLAELYKDQEAQEEYNDSMDGDHETALASAGWGTDEDYGGCDERL